MGRRLILSVIVVLGFIGLAMASSETGKNADRTAAADSGRAAPVAPGTPVAAERDTSAGQWRMEEGTSPLDDSRSVDLSVREVWVHPGDTAARSAVLHVRCLEDRTRVFVQTRDRFSPADQPERLRVYEVPVRLRIDDRPVQAQTWRESDDATAIHAPKAIALARQLAGRRRVRIEYTTYDRGARVVTFPIHGLEQRLGEVAKACHWTF